MEISKLNLRFEVSSDNEKIVDINEENWMVEYETEGAFTNNISIKILGQSNDSNKYIDIGVLDGRYFKVGKIIDKQASLFDVFDSIDQDTHMVYKALVDEDNYFNFEYCGIKSNVFHIERFFVNERFRSHGIGEKILDDLDDVLNYSLNCEIGCYIVLPKPIEQNSENGFNILRDQELKKQLLSFYWKCGYLRIPDTEFMYINTDEIKTKRVIKPL